MEQWYCAVRSEKYGPISLDDLKNWILWWM